MRTSRLVAAGIGVVALLGGALVLRPAEAATTPAVVGAGPISDPTDTPYLNYLRVTFSPDGNGVDDRVLVRATSARGEQLALLVHAESNPKSFVAATVAATGGTTTLAWDGRTPNGRVAPDASYILRVCDAGTTRCAATEVMAHLRILSVYAPEVTAVSPGQTIPVVIQTDRPGPFTIDLRPAAQPLGPGVGAISVASAGTWHYTVPAVDGGLWIVHVTSGDVYSQYPLAVHSSIPFDNPPHGTALVVYPYMTWRAYNDADTNRDGQVDSWYAHPRNPVVPLVGPFESFRQEAARAGREADPDDQQAFARWRASHAPPAQYVTDIELGRLPLSTLQHYSLIVFPGGHIEYYEQATYERLLAYRNGGGRLYFISGNPFYGQVKVGPTTITRLTYRYRTPTQSDFALASVGFVTCCWPRTITPRYHVTAAAIAALPWLFAGTGVKAGSAFGRAEGEVDTVDPKLSPPGTVVVASAHVPPFKSVGGDEAPQGWLGSKPFTYERPSNRAVTLDVAYAATGKGAVFSWGNEGFMTSLYDPALPQPERVALDRAAWNVWTWFAR